MLDVTANLDGERLNKNRSNLITGSETLLHLDGKPLDSKSLERKMVFQKKKNAMQISL